MALRLPKLCLAQKMISNIVWLKESLKSTVRR